MDKHQLVIAAVVCLNLAVLLGAVDGLYFHLWKYRLFGHDESRCEHLLHTIRAFLFIPIVWLIFGENYGGWLWWCGVAAVAADQAVELLDVLIERRSRARLGGLSTGEYAIHVNASSLRIAALALMLAAKPAAAWSLSAPPLLEPAFPDWVTMSALGALPGAVLGGVLHLWLMRAKYRVH